MATSTTRSKHEPDGRQQRAQRSREAIVEALFALVGEGVALPTAQQVAARAQVGTRSLFRHFTDMDELYAAICAPVYADAAATFDTPPARGTLAVRVRALIALRTGLFERIAPYRRAAMIHASRSEFIQARQRELTDALRADLHQRIPEVDTAPPGVADALDVALSFETWNRLRTDQRLGVHRAREALERLALAVVRDARGEDAQ